MVDFDYTRPTTVAEAADLLQRHAEARALAGGQTLIPALKHRLTRPTLLVDLQALREMQGIRVGDSEVEVGAMTRHADVAGHADLAAACPALAHLASGIAHPQVRHMGTLGGSISNHDPASDYPAALVGLNATVRTQRRRIAAEQFFTGLFSTALEPGELVLAVHFPRVRRAGYCKFANPASGYVTTGAFVALTEGGVRVAINGASACVFRQPAFEAALTQRFDPDALRGLQHPSAGLQADLHANADYRAQLVHVATRRAAAMALSQA